MPTILILCEKLHKILRKNVLYYNLLKMFFKYLNISIFYITDVFTTTTCVNLSIDILEVHVKFFAKWNIYFVRPPNLIICKWNDLQQYLHSYIVSVKAIVYTFSLQKNTHLPMIKCSSWVVLTFHIIYFYIFIYFNLDFFFQKKKT